MSKKSEKNSLSQNAWTSAMASVLPCHAGTGLLPECSFGQTKSLLGVQARLPIQREAAYPSRMLEGGT